MLQIPASWGVNGLDVDTAGRLYNKARTQLSVGPMPDNLRTAYLDDFMHANEMLGMEYTTGEQVLCLATSQQLVTKLCLVIGLCMHAS